MANEIKDANQEEAQPASDSSTEEAKQTENASEGAKTPVGAKDDRTKYEEALAALKEERERRKEAEKIVRESEDQEVPPSHSDDAVYQDYLRTKADAYIAKQLTLDRTFKDRLDDIEYYMKQGHSIDMADKMAKADLADKLLTELAKEEKVEKPKQIKPNAAPEEESKPAPTYADIKSGKAKGEGAEEFRRMLNTFD